MIKVGITGGIGSGKSIVCELFKKFGIQVYNADIEAKILMNSHPNIIAGLTQRFGNQVYIDGMLNRPFLAQLIFNDKDALQYVNSLVHPAVYDDFNRWALQYTDNAYVIEEAALLFENGGFALMDAMICVTAPEDIRIARVVKRDSVSPEQVRDRIKNQLPDDYKVQKSNFVVFNDERQSVVEQVLHIHNKLLRFL